MLQVKITPMRGTSEAVQRKLRDLSARIKNPIQANAKVSIWLLRWVNTNFDSEGGKVGGWAPLKAGGRWRKKAGKRHLDTSAKVLQDIGRLKASFMQGTFYGRLGAGVGSAMRYAPFHDIGMPSRNLPQRRMLPQAGDQDVEQAVIKIYDAHIEQALR